MDPNNPLANLSPEQIQALFQMGGLNRQDDLLQQQLAMAEAIRNRPQPQSYGALAGIGNGLASAFNGINSALRENKAMQGLQDNQRMESAAGQNIGIDAMRRDNPSYGMVAPMPTVQPNRIASSMAGMVGEPDAQALSQARVAALRNRPPPMLARDDEPDDGTDFGGY